MKLLLVSQYYEPAWDYGGPAAKVTAISRHLAGRGHEVEVLTSSVASAHRNGLNARGTRRLGKVTVHYLPSAVSYRGVSINPGVGSFCRRRLDGFDLVHIFGVYDWLGTMTCKAARARRKPYVVEPLGMYRPMERGYFRKWVYRRLVGEEFLRSAARVIATSDAEFEQLGSMGVTGHGNVMIRRNGIELEELPRVDDALRRDVRSRLRIPEGDRIVLFLGRIAPIKHLELLLEAFDSSILADVHLVIAGPAPDRRYLRVLRDAASRMEAHRRIHFHEAVHGEQKGALLADAALVVLSSRSESFGNVVAEAVAADVPVVVTDGCGVASIVRDRVGLVSEQSARQFGAALRELLQNRTLYATFKANCTRVKREFSWEEPIDMLERTYAEILAKDGDRELP